MMRFCLFVSAVVVLAAADSAAVAQNVQPVPEETAQRLGTLLTKVVAGIERPQVKIKGDPAETVAVAVRDPEAGFLLVPQNGLDEEERPDITGKNGVPLGLFFSMANFAPVIQGKLIDRDKLYGLVVNDGRGLSVVNCMLLSVRKISDEDYRLYGFGKPTKPLIDVKFSGGRGPGAEPVALEIKEGKPAEFVITLFDKYQAKFHGSIAE